MDEDREYAYDLKIPKERVAVLIGKDGAVKKEIEDRAHVHLEIDSKEGDIEIVGSDPIGLLNAREVIRAIGRGFNPEIAMLLLKGDYVFELISMNDFAKTKDSMVRLKGRVIGREGKSRSMIEELTESNVSVFGKTVGIIGRAEGVSMAKRAVESLLKGSPHAKVYHWLETKKKQFRLEDG